MKTNSKKKRIAFSTQVMILVAILAIATITISWFTANNKADADGINVTSVQGAYLQISEDNVNWSSVINYKNDDPDKNRTSNLTQVSSAFENLLEPVFWQGYGSTDDNYYASSFSTVNYLEESGYVNVYDLYAKIADGKTYNLMAKIKGNITDIGSIGDGFGRIAVVRYKNEDVGDTDNSMKIYYMAQDDNPLYPINEAGNVAGQFPINPVHGNFDESLGKISTSTHFKIYVWYEGQDKDCTTNNLDGELKFDLELYLKDVDPIDDGESFIKVFGS